MSRTIAYCVLIVAFGVVAALSACAPNVLGDSNSFLKELVGAGLLNILAVIVSITLASASQLHLAFNRIERAAGKRFLHRSRAGVRQACYFLIALLITGVLLVVIKPLVALSPWSQSLVNGLALWVLLWNVLILISITSAVFAIGPEAPDDSRD